MDDDPYKSLYEVLKTDLTLENATALLSIEKRLNKLERENKTFREQLEILERKNARLSEVNDWLDQRSIRIEGDFAECVRVGADLEVRVQQLKKRLQESSNE